MSSTAAQQGTIAENEYALSLSCSKQSILQICQDVNQCSDIREMSICFGGND